MRIGILGTADIAYRRFLPALKQCPEWEYAGVASRTVEKTTRFVGAFGGQGYESYEALLADESIDAVYVPLPPALHYQWGKKALESGKHLLMEKPFTTNLRDAEVLLALAEKNNLAVHENYMFLYHSQLAKVRELIGGGTLGVLRLIRASFGFPKRAENDFRYNRALGGGALLDCGGYPVRLALELLGESATVVQSCLVQPKGYEVDLYGSAVLENDDGLCAQIAFGMDNAYQCQLEVWGSKATLIAPRVFTAGSDVRPKLILRSSTGKEQFEMEEDDQFLHSIETFARCIEDGTFRHRQYREIAKQERVVEAVQKRGEIG